MASILRPFRHGEDGAILVEFGMILPIMLLFFGLMIEGARMLWSYQTAVSGVRDASRYLARITPKDICASGGTVSQYTATLRGIVENDLAGNGLMPDRVTINSVTPTYGCVAGTYRLNPVPVATVTASMTIEMPLASIMSMFGDSMSQVTTSFSDSSRIFGN